MLVWGWWLACSGDPCTDGPLDITVGTGITGFVPLTEGDDVTMVFGPQGGWHIDVSARIAGAGSDVIIRPSVVRVSDAMVLAGDQPETFLALASFDQDTCTGDALAVRAFLDDAPESDDLTELVCDLDGVAVELIVEVSDFGDRTSRERLVVTARTAADQSCP